MKVRISSTKTQHENLMPYFQEHCGNQANYHFIYTHFIVTSPIKHYKHDQAPQVNGHLMLNDN